MNPGGVRSDLTYAQSGAEGDGVVTYGEAFTFQPFGNTLLTFPMTGAQIVSVLEEQCQPAGSSRPFLHLGVSEGFTYDLSTTIVAGDCTVGDGEQRRVERCCALIPGSTYIVTANSFLADGGDNFVTFADDRSGVATRRRQRPRGARQLPGCVQPGGSSEHRSGQRTAVERPRLDKKDPTLRGRVLCFPATSKVSNSYRRNRLSTSTGRVTFRHAESGRINRGGGPDTLERIPAKSG